MTKKIAFTIENLNFAFDKNSPPFFKELSIEFEEKKIHFIRGANGSGKSTLFRIFQGKIDQSEVVSGKIQFNKQKYKFNHLKQSVKRNSLNRIKMVQQKFDLMLADQLSFAQNLKLANILTYPSLRGLPNHQKLPTFVARFKIDINKPVYLLSGGQRQILAILMALQKPARILLLDEPTAALDDQNSKMVMEFLLNLVSSTNLTVLIICHDKELVNLYAPEGNFEMAIDEKTHQRTVSFSSI